MSKIKEFAVQFSPNGALDLETLAVAGEALNRACKNGVRKTTIQIGGQDVEIDQFPIGNRQKAKGNPLVPSMLFPATKVREVLVFETTARVFWREGTHSEHEVSDPAKLLTYCRNKGIRADDRRPKAKKEDGLIGDVKNIPPAGEELPRPKEDFVDQIELLEMAKNIIKTKPVWAYTEAVNLFKDSKSVVWLHRHSHYQNSIYLAVMRRTDQKVYELPAAMTQDGGHTWLWLNEVAVDWPRLYGLMAEHVRPAYEPKKYVDHNGHQVSKAMAQLFASLK